MLWLWLRFKFNDIVYRSKSVQKRRKEEHQRNKLLPPFLNIRYFCGWQTIGDESLNGCLDGRRTEKTGAAKRNSEIESLSREVTFVVRQLQASYQKCKICCKTLCYLYYKCTYLFLYHSVILPTYKTLPFNLFSTKTPN